MLCEIVRPRLGKCTFDLLFLLTGLACTVWATALCVRLSFPPPMLPFNYSLGLVSIVDARTRCVEPLEAGVTAESNETSETDFTGFFLLIVILSSKNG